MTGCWNLILNLDTRFKFLALLGNQTWCKYRSRCHSHRARQTRIQYCDSGNIFVKLVDTEEIRRILSETCNVALTFRAITESISSLRSRRDCQQSETTSIMRSTYLLRARSQVWSCWRHVLKQSWKRMLSEKRKWSHQWRRYLRTWQPLKQTNIASG